MPRGLGQGRQIQLAVPLRCFLKVISPEDYCLQAEEPLFLLLSHTGLSWSSPSWSTFEVVVHPPSTSSVAFMPLSGSETSKDKPSTLGDGSSLLVEEMPAPILLPALFVRFGAERLLFTIADALDAAGVDAGLQQSVLHRIRPVVT